jgi:hypothetical protein
VLWWYRTAGIEAGSATVRSSIRLRGVAAVLAAQGHAQEQKIPQRLVVLRRSNRW